MPYIIHTFDGVGAYLDAVPNLSAEGRRRVVEAYLHDLAEHADEFMRNAPLAPESHRFQYEYVLRDGAFFYSFRFIGDGSGMPTGWSALSTSTTR